jgi:hypothetical protein
MCDDNNLDQILDAALSTYADPGPNSGLDDRVLAHIAAARPTAKAEPVPFKHSTRAVPLLRPGKDAMNRRRWLPWAIALPVAACLLLIFFMPKDAPLHSNQTNQASPPAPLAAMCAEAPETGTMHRKPHLQPVARAAQPAPLPKLDVFPTPRPLTTEEQALIVFISRASDSERKALIESQEQLQAPISIAAIRIPPLEPLKPLDQDTPDPNSN